MLPKPSDNFAEGGHPYTGEGLEDAPIAGCTHTAGPTLGQVYLSPTAHQEKVPGRSLGSRRMHAHTLQSCTEWEGQNAAGGTGSEDIGLDRLIKYESLLLATHNRGSS